MKKILVPTDFSDCADLAVEAAVRLAKQNGAAIYFLHYLSVPDDWADMPEHQHIVYPDISRKVMLAEDMLEELVTRVERQGVQAYQEVAYNEGADSILGFIKNHTIDLVIMGSHGARGMKEFFLGSNAQRVVRYAEVPVLIIKKAFSIPEYASIVFTSDFSGEAIHSFLKILEFAHVLHAKIHLLYINMPNTFEDTWTIRERMESFVFAASDSLAAAEIIDAHDFEEGLAKYCERIGGGMVAMVTHGHKGISRMYQSSLAEKVVNHVDLPFLSVKV